VSVSGVTGEVVDIGLVRFHLLEMVSGEGVTPTGRVVAFSNTIVFQSGAGLFKQIPGTSFVWHEVTVRVSPDSDYGAVEERLRPAVEAVLSEYQEEIEEQHRNMEKTLNIVSVGALRPKTRLRLTQPGIEVVIVYPVDMVHAAEIDDRVTREVLKALDREHDIRPGDADDSPVRLDTNPSA
jgi:small-conductance mechanosensitive channel